MRSFKAFVRSRELREEAEVPPGVDPAMWANPSYQKFWLAQNPNYGQQQQAPAPVAKALAPNQAQQQLLQRELQKVNIFKGVLEKGFETGGRVPTNIVVSLRLNDENRSLVADSEQFAMGGAYPFFKDKRAGQYTGAIMFKRGYPINTFMDKMTKLLQERLARRSA